jgi:STE24 endopeptidase
MYNGSRQSNDFTANAGGVGSSASVAISDVALNKASLDEVRAVVGHELGHYVLKHSWYAVLFYSIAAILLFWVVDRSFPWFTRRFGSSAGLVEPRGVPVLIFMLSLFGLLALPVFNTFSRAIENQADLYSLRTENRPDALASALVKTADYRNPQPGGIEEIIFYSHPSVERRVRRAMAWKAAHPGPPGGG